MMKEALKKFIRKQFLLFAKIGCCIAPYAIGPLLAKREYRVITGRKLNLKNPQNLIEKIVWMQFHTDTSLWTQCADKLGVRDYVKSKALGDLLPNIYGIWEDPDDIDFNRLPNSFILKTNNSSGQVIIVRDKHTDLNPEKAKKELKKWLKQSYGSHNGQLHYLKIKPLAFAEELLVDPRVKEDESPIDYKFYCINGEPRYIFTINARKGDYHEGSFYDLEWHNISEKVMVKESTYYGNVNLEKPEKLEDMLQLSRILSKDFPQVRVDFYEIGSKIYFGELTLTTGYGFNTEEFYNELGALIDLSKLKKIR